MTTARASAASNGTVDLNAAIARIKRLEVTFDAKGKLQLPAVPNHDKPLELAAWLTSVLQLDPEYPVRTAVHQGLRGPEGHVVIERIAAPPIRFEPAAAMNTARRLLPILGWQLGPTDGEPYGFKDEHARRIAHVVRLLCARSDEVLEADETAGIVGLFLQEAIAVEGHTVCGTGPQRYEAAAALRRTEDENPGRAIGPARYLIDSNTGECVIRVSDLQDTARRYTGSSLPRGWVDGRMDDLGWTRRVLDGHAAAGRGGRSGPHRRVKVYIGHVTPLENDHETGTPNKSDVTT